MASCPHCSAAFDPPARGRPKVYCSTACRRAAQNLRRCPDPERRRGPRRPTAPRPGPRRQPRQRAPVGTQHWMTDPTVSVCKVDNCFFDAGTCSHRR